MAMSFASSSAVPGANARTASGDELQEIAVESLNFKALGGEKKIKLLPQPWPLNDLPSSTSSLLSISSKQGLLAAAGPNSLVLARTKAVRDAFTASGDEIADNVKDFRPALQITVPKLSQVAFTAEGTYLVICAQEGGGLGVYETLSILQDKKDPAFQLPTNGISIRALAPNPAPEFAHLVAVILVDGKLLIADLRNRDFIKNASGSPALKEGVAAVSWSNRGKQLTAGMADGNCFQLDQSGTVKASIPTPPDLPSPCHVSSLVWLANDEWLIYHTPNTPEDPDRAPESIMHHVQSDKERTQFAFRKPAIEPVGAWGMNRAPVTHYISRLRNWYNVKDWLILSSVVSSETAMLTNATVPLAADNPVTGSYTVTTFANDSSRVSVPMTISGEMDTTAIGMALDLSSTDKVLQPIPGDEMDESPFPLPALMLLNNEGILVSSWVVYNDALRNNQPCPDMVSAQQPGGIASPQTPSTGAFGAAVTSPTTSAFSSGFPKPAVPAFGQSTFGSAGAAPAFGGASQMGSRQSVWGAGAGAGSGTAKPAGAVFGQSGLGAGKPTFGSTSAFGAAAGGAAPFGAAANKPAASPFGTLGAGSGTAKPAASPFGAFAGGSAASPFGAMASNASPFAQQAKPGQSAFATSGTTTGSTPAASFGMSSQPSFGSTVSIDTSAGGSTLGGKSVFGTPAQPGGIFNKPSLTPAETQESDMMDDGEKAPTPKEDKPAGLFGLAPGGFKLGSTFKPGNQEDKPDAEDDKPKNEPRPKGLFGADFGAALGDTQKEQEKTASPQIKKEPGEAKPSLFSIPAVKQEADKPKTSLFGSTTTVTPESSFTFGKASPTPSSLKPEPEPPQVTSKPAPSPSTTTAPSSDSKASSKASKDGSDDSHPLAGSEAEAIEMPESDDEDLSEHDDEPPPAPMPPDPSTIKVSKGFYNDIPGQKPAAAPPKAPSPPPPQKQLTIESPLFGGKMSTTPAGFPKAPQMFAPPVPSVRDSPRSPSPIRSASTPAGKPFSKPPSRPPSVRPQFAPSVPPPQPKPVEPVVTPASLQDKEAERNQAILQSSIQPTLQLANYITHQDYVGNKGEGKVSAQIETLFCDINSMVDTLGLNARALTEFVEGHNSLMPDNGRTKEDLERLDEDEDWCLVEIDELMTIERSLADEIDSERVEDKEGKVAELYTMRRELVRAKNKLKEVKRFLEQAKNEEQKEQRRQAPLDKATEAKQREIRRDMAKFLKVLVEAEEAVSMLKVKLASSGRQAAGQVPTVEAVEKTVKKMTQWAEEKGADMDVLEAQMKKLGLVGAARPSSSNMRASNGFRRSGLFSTPSPKKTPKKGSSFAVPEESDSESEAATDGFVDVDPMKEIVRDMVEARKKKTAVMGRVRDAIRKRGVKVTEG